MYNAVIKRLAVEGKILVVKLREFVRCPRGINMGRMNVMGF